MLAEKWISHKGVGSRKSAEAVIGLGNMEGKLPQILAVIGPTCSGKTGIGIALAKYFDGEVICADSRTVYKGMDIGDGGTASAEFFRITYGDCTDAEKKKVRDNLLKYCELDTMAEVMIVEKLREIIN